MYSCRLPSYVVLSVRWGTDSQLIIPSTHLINAPGIATRAKAPFIEAWNAGLKARSSTDCAQAHL